MSFPGFDNKGESSRWLNSRWLNFMELSHSIGLFLRELPTLEILNITQKYEIKAHLGGCTFLSVLGRLKRTSVPGLSNREISFFMSGWPMMSCPTAWAVITQSKNWKKLWNLCSELLKRDGTRNLLKALKWVFRTPSVLLSKYFGLTSSLSKSRRVQVENRRKKGIF